MDRTDELTQKPSVAKELTLDCGRYDLRGIQVYIDVTLHVTGRTVLAIDENAQLSGALEILVEPGTELALFLTGSIEFQNTVDIGNSDSPKAPRLYVGGDSVTTSAEFDLSANFCMPHARFNLTSALDMKGALFARDYCVTGPITVHDDDGLVNVRGYRIPGDKCESCDDCVNPTPTCAEDGSCGPCEVDSDCCHLSSVTARGCAVLRSPS